MFEKFFNTASAERKLPVPFFEVLDQEQSALHGADRSNFSWDFAESHFKESLDIKKLADAIKKLFTADEQKKFSAATRKDLVARLNEILHAGRCLYHEKNFPKTGLSKEIVAMTGLKLEASEVTRLNRLLLEAAFPDDLRTIADIHIESIYRRIHAGEGSTALCFSGGGIRSATFALGVAQGLAQRGVMKHFDYLSTVSGGGYIGSWLSSWIHRTGDAQKVFDALAPQRATSPMDAEPPTLDHLRKYSNYLTPKLGLFSADAWTLVATYLRNLLLNWTIFIPLLIAFFALPRLHVALLLQPQPPWLVGLTFLAGCVLAAGSLAYCAMNRPAVAENLQANGGAWFRRRGQDDFLMFGLVPLCLAAVCLTTGWAWAHNYGGLHPHNFLLKALLNFIGCTAGAPPPRLLNFCVLGAAVHLAGWIVSECFLQRWEPGKLKRLSWEFLLALLAGAVGGILLWLTATKLPFHAEGNGPMLYGCFAAPLVMILFLFAATVFIGIGSKFTSDEDREWWARMGGWMFIAIFGWAGFAALVLFGPLGLLACWFWAPKTMSLLGGASGLFTLIVGYSGNTDAKKDSKNGGGSLASGLMDKVLKLLAAPLSLALLVILVSLATSWLLVQTGRQCGLDFSPLGGFTCELITEHFKQVLRETPAWYVAVFLIATAAVGWILSWLININKFSLHAIYRNRLVRAYLGASNFKRDPNPFTGFDPADNLPLAHLRITPPGRAPRSDDPPQRPLHIVNMALNLVTGDNLAWQQRKAETFTASTFHCGNFRLGYRFTKHYSVGKDQTGLKLGTAVAISGAAASPNQGYHSSPLVALLMTLFNVRLGWWLGNPGAMGHDTFSDPSPRSPVVHYLKEGLGLTNNTSPYVYLSDGGHFENLGLYEMVLRRCRLIVVSDAGCDPGCALEDLGGAIRKIRVDLGVKIEMKKFEIFSRDDEAGAGKGHYCAIGEIDYGAADEGGRKGTLIYLKPALIGGEPRDVYNYSCQCAEFPHESTGDQWFSESQFESYRALGQKTIEWMFSWRSSGQPKPVTREEVLADLVHQAYTAAETPRPTHADSLFASGKNLGGSATKA